MEYKEPELDSEGMKALFAELTRANAAVVESAKKRVAGEKDAANTEEKADK